MTTEICLYADDGGVQHFVITGDQQWYEFAHPVQVKRFQVRYVPDVKPEPESPASPEYLAHVLAWLQRDDGGGYSEAVAVEHVRTDASDWEGDTYGGFYSTFAVEIKWRKAGSDEPRYFHAAGEAAASLWDWVVGNWPASAEAEA